MRTAFSILYISMALALAGCSMLAMKSHKTIGPSVALLVASLIPPVIGNLFLIMSSNQLISTAGCYIYFLGMDLVMYSLLRFSFDYCHLSWKNEKIKWFVHFLLFVDVFQYLVNPIFHQAFTTEMILVEGRPYYRLIPFLGQTYHRVVDYGIYLASVVIFLVKMIRSPRVYAERYSVILFSMVVGGLWQTFYIFSRTPVDQSMIGFSIFGLLVYYFSIHYRPLRLLDRMLANIASQLPEAMFFFDHNGTCIWANQPGIRLSGIQDEIFETAAKSLTGIFGQFEHSESWKTRRIITRDREKKYFALEKQTVRDENGKIAGSFLSVRDETENMLALEKEQYNARHDNLTGLYTREYLYERMREEMPRHPELSWLVLYLDVNDFKMINDIFGPSYGDFALISIAGMLKEELPETAIYGRLSGDQFGICVPAADFDQDHLEDVLEDFAVNDGTVGHHILIHGGIYEVNEPDLDIGIMFDRARMAMANIKGSYQIHLARFDEKMRDEALWTQYLSGQINEAIEKRQIIPYLQAMVNSEGTVVGAEALVRWNHPKYGFLSPARFIPIFEKNGMIAEVDKYMWKCACEILASWKKTHPDLFLSVNISPKDFYFTDVEEEIRNAAREYDVDPSRLRLEITETVMMTDITNRVKILNSLKESGFLVEMDDFGSGYSSLNLLKDMPVDVIKIDMMFLNKSDNETKAKMILKNIIRLSENLGIEPLTEGVETRDQFTMLNQMGCRLFQGFYFAKPMPLESFEKLLDHPDISKLN